jgi:hypothetical protein
MANPFSVCQPEEWGWISRFGAVNAHHQFEFLIRFANFNRRDLSRCISKLPRRPDARRGRPHYELRLEDEGFYFRDLARSGFSAKILRIVLELALEHSDVQIEGFGSGVSPVPGSGRTREFAAFHSMITSYRQAQPGFGGGEESAQFLGD